MKKQNHSSSTKNGDSPKPPLRYQTVESYILNYIRENNLKPGDPVPTLSQLKKALKMNEISLRRGIHELIIRNVLEAQQGRGTFLTEGALPRILWVSGHGAHAGLDSPHTYEMFRLVEERCHHRGMQLVPVAISASEYYEPALAAHGGDGVISGYVFSSCDNNHRLLRRAREEQIPHVDLTAYRTAPTHCCQVDKNNAIQKGREWFIARGRTEISVILYGMDYQPPLVSRAKIDYHSIPWARRFATEVEAKGYYYTRDLIREERLLQTVYISDNILAKGVTRAILAHHPDPRSLEIMVQGTTNHSLPYGLPVHLISYYLEDHANAAMEMFDEQFRGNPTPPTRFMEYELHPKETLSEEE